MKQYKINVNGKNFNVCVTETTLGGEVSTPIATPTPTPVAKPVEKNVAAINGQTVTAPMPGTVLKIKVNSGATVKTGQAIIVLEAMKMENEIAATADGKVTLSVNEGDKVNSGDVIATIA